nr:MAG TPA: hypothetical protein [Caudoviricetes sp.]
MKLHNESGGKYLGGPGHIRYPLLPYFPCPS